jgi:hypothetical protein
MGGMSLTKKLRRWRDHEVRFLGDTIRVQVKVPNVGEGHAALREHRKGVGAFVVAYNRLKENPQDAEAAAIVAAYDPVKILDDHADEVRDLFSKAVRPHPEDPLEDEDGQPITTGAQLFTIFSPAAAVSCVGRISMLGILTESEGKASSPPSTSAVEPPTTPGGSPATTTESAGGLAPSTATESTDTASSSVVERVAV